MSSGVEPQPAKHREEPKLTSEETNTVPCSLKTKLRNAELTVLINIKDL